MRLSSATTADRVLTQLQTLSQQQADLQQQIATGQRVTTPGDDPAAMGRLLQAQAEQRSILQFERNAAAAQEYSSTTYSTLEQLKDLSDRAGELAILGTGTAGEQAMQAYAAEVDQLLEQAVSLGNSTLRQDHLFAGTAVDAAPFAVTRDADGQLTGVTYAGNTGRLTVPIATGVEVAPTASAETSAGLAEFMNQLVALRDALNAGDTAAVQATRSGLETSEDLLVAGLAEHGAVQLRIEVAESMHTARQQELERQISAEAEVDLPTTIVELTQTTQSYEAALSTAATVLNMSLLDYIR